MHLPVLWLLFVEMVLFSVFAFLYIKENVVYALHSKTNGSIVVPFFFNVVCFLLFLSLLLGHPQAAAHQARKDRAEPSSPV